MNGAFFIGATGLRTQEQALDAAANNIANINTPGYKRAEVRFSELVPPPADAADPANLVIGGGQTAGLSGVTAISTSRIFTQGELRPTGKALDLAIQGEGFIEVLGPDGQEMLWRGGALKVNADGFLATANGAPLKALIAVPAEATQLTIGRDGRVLATLDGQAAPAEIGRIDLVTVRDTSSLAILGDGFYRAETPGDLSASQPGVEGAGQLVQGSLEASNVELTNEMVSLMLTQRAYAANSQVIQAGDQLMSIANGLRR